MTASIEYIERIIATYEEATEANSQTPGRVGNIVEVTAEAADEVMITADVHGHRMNFNAIRTKADLAANPRRHLVLQEVCHGGPPSPSGNGCMSYTLLEDVARLKVEFPQRVHFILSNHELAELTDYPILKAKRMLNVTFRAGLQEMYGPATDKVREALLRFLRSCPLGVRLVDVGVFICHSAPERVDLGGFDMAVFDRPLSDADLGNQGGAFALVWGRDYRAANARAFAELVGAHLLVHGHDPCPEGFKAPNEHQIILDCCGAKPHYLTLSTSEAVSHAEAVERITPLR
ncbi:MAG: hypothetical protein IIA67_04505 [Planctomycetes bacterium]|nr:hypothetical protein [Planctomycetota bacterium]